MSEGGALGSTAFGAQHRSVTELPSYALRPGVTFPDWSVVSSPTARDALMATLSAFDLTRRWGGYGEQEDQVRQAIIKGLAELGHEPATDWLARRTRLDEAHVAPLVHQLVSRDLVVCDESDAIVGAYPLTTRSTEHRVVLGDRAVRAMCAVDALGAGAMFGTDSVIESRCRACGIAIRVTTKDLGTELDRVEPGAAIVWSGIRYAGACAATSLCTVIAFFCSEAHLEAWGRTNHPEAVGSRLTLDEALQIGRALFSPVLRLATGTVGTSA